MERLREHWLLDPAVTFLNHGSFGACPRPVLEAQQRWRERIERQPVRFFVRDLEPALDEAREALARFVGAGPDDLALVSNATTGVNTVVASLALEPGDELLTTDHAYNACKNALDLVAARARARVVVARVPFPVRGPDEVAGALLAAAGPRTRLALVDHVTSPTALVFPVARIVRELEGRGVPVLVDGAHAPGMLPLDLEALGASYYTGNCHKWLCAPKGSAFLHVRRDRKDGVRPLVTSHGANRKSRTRSPYRVEFDWTGTGDPTPWLCVPDALRFVGGLVPGGWPEVMERNRALARAGRRLLCERLGLEAPCPEDMLGSMAALRLPDGPEDPEAAYRETDPLQDLLLDRYAIEVPIPRWPRPPARLVRVSAALYGHEGEYERLAEALRVHIR